MGLIESLMGNASELPKKSIMEKLGDFICDGEVVEKGYQMIRDYFIFTDKRLILIDVQGMTGKKLEYRSIPYKSILQYSIETSGPGDPDAELRIYLPGSLGLIERQFGKNVNVFEVECLLSKYVLEKDK